MFSSLRVRLFASYILLIFLSLAVAAPAMVYLLRGYQDKLAQARLADIILPLTTQMRDMTQQGRSAEEMLTYLSTQADELGVRILLVNTDGRIIRDTAKADSLEGQLLRLPLLRLASTPRQPYMGKYLGSGNRPFLFTAVLAKGVLGSDRRNANIAALVVAQPEARFGAVLRDLLPTLLFSAGVALSAALLIGFFLTRFILRPIGTFAKASEGIAKGHYEQRVPVADPSEFRHLAETFNVMAYEVGRSRQMMRDFLANVAHEFKTPLTSIRGFVQAQLDGTVKDEAGREKSLRIVDGEAARLQRLVAELLELSRLEARQISMAREPVKLSELLEQCVEIFALRAQENEVKLSTNVAAELTVVGDFDRLEQVFTNLVDNALKHVPAGGQISLSANSSAGGMASVIVTDNGPGIDEKDLSHLFERFYVGDNSASRPGAGLGLAIAREIARSHGGDIAVESLKGMGTRFVVTLPST